MAASSSHQWLAPPQPSIQASIPISCMNFDGTDPWHCRSTKTGKLSENYKELLEKRMEAMKESTAVAGITEMNPIWYGWYLENVMTKKRWKDWDSVHDEHDCAFFWDKKQVVPTSPASPRTLTYVFEENEIPTESKYETYWWRQLMTVEFQSVKYPSNVFKCTITHSISGSISEGEKQTKMSGNIPNHMARIQYYAMDKFGRVIHEPSLAAGRPSMSVIMGDFNVFEKIWKQNLKDAIDAIPTLTQVVEKTSITAKDAVRRDFMAMLCQNQEWEAFRNDDVASSRKKTLNWSKEHKPLFSLSGVRCHRQQCQGQPRRGRQMQSHQNQPRRRGRPWS